ncbi:PAS domain S-box protein [Natrarchaeobius oligotrophus]|uniref:histidine kinase n=1 Tax=Natrarchaeobius chitinivorans TaxID=1679083 RepID=A0A3N6PFR8_NATCH|nr:PAS domain S-box protein [Natrarchaeobius chitinivorans]RQG98959.1 PAS domain S-box protein [Natrarchaeobius chitinivorans]
MTRVRDPRTPVVVLHVDDDESLAELTATFLEREAERIDVITATSAEEGLELLGERPIDCVVSDYDMPETNGLEFLEVVRRDHESLPFILFTGKGSEEIASEAISHGVTDYLQKEGGTEQYTILANRVLNAVETTTAQRQQRRQLDAIQTAREGISILDEDGRFVFVNDAYASMYGYEPDEMIGRSWEITYPEDGVEFARETILPEVGETGYWHGETQGLRSDGTTFVEDHVVSSAEDGELVCTVRDVTDEKERKVELRELDQFRQAIIESANVWINVLDDSGNVVVWNEAAAEISGYSAEEVVGHDEIWERLYPDEEYRNDILEHVGSILRDEKAVEEFETTIRTKSGENRLISWHSQALMDESGRVEGSVAIGRDITDQYRAKRRYRTLIENLPGIVYRAEIDSSWPFEFVHGQAESITGYTTDELREGVSWGDDVVHPDDRDRIYEEVRSAVERERPFELTYRIRTKDGEPCWVWEQGQRVDDDLVEGLITDVTDRKEREQQLNEQNRRLEEFASVVSHDLRNPLNVATGRLELARERHESEHLDAIASSLSRMERIIDSMLWLTREEREIGARSRVVLDAVVSRAWDHVATGDATLETEMTDESIVADETRLLQLFENLFRNAVEHGGETVTVRVGTLSDRPGFYVEDDGPGIPPERRDRVFEAGYSTARRGTGFGLRIVKGIVDGHGWEISVTAGIDGGTRFEIVDVEDTSHQ